MKNTLEISIEQPLEWMRYLKNSIKGLIALGFFLLLGVLLANIWIVLSTEKNNFYNLQKMPSNDVGLVLGTSKAIIGGKENKFFKYRMEAAARLYKEGKVKFLILSGNHDSVFYNEPNDMKKALMSLGVPENVMTLDFAGFRTYDSIIRCKEVFNQQKFTIISQPTHNARALFLAHELGVDAVAFAAQDVPAGYKTYLREYLARPKAILDVYLLDRSKYSSKKGIDVKEEKR
ncbi:ElyC/SanA/YdcF family protein [Arcicella sp. LKC2W]|uniref:SanA/YdcF family protein n=1 Tax=Arcicella sp. LKC2W TaxID=2984198 RepID=UPI002B20CA45|nr:ElyC/SanA/YdcF family protein [Arcicella sp. LKC2W]MEA5457463.1 ElyC/SanA/YdcF family protein [Arcicella sp. LKC2W]